MTPITTFAEAHEALRPLYNNTRTPYTLDAPRALLEFVGAPQNKVRVIHVAGTSGKTSTAYYIAKLLQASGKKVGLSVSPHVDEVNERLQINGMPLSEAEFCRVLTEFMELIADCDVKPSYFELLTAMAFWEFARQGADYAVMEVGLGGLLDGTNVVDRADKVCIITDIGLDHTEILGDTLPEIAAQKAGTIQEGNTVIMYTQSEAVMGVVRRRVADKKASLIQLSEADYVNDVTLPRFQQRNLGLAVRAVNTALQGEQLVGREELQQAIALTIPARLERFRVGDKLVIVDGSHNDQKLTMLRESIAALYPNQLVAVLAGFVQGNEARWQGGLRAIMPIAEHIIFTSFASSQDVPKSSVDLTAIAAFCTQAGYVTYELQPDPKLAFEALLQRSEPILLVTGSFYLLNHIRPLIKAQP